jgi:predicted HTH transcriptional regulator
MYIHILFSVGDGSVVPLELAALRISRQSSSASAANSSNSVSALSSSSSSSASKSRIRKSATTDHQLSALKELVELWNIKSKEENHSAEDRYQLLELRDKILRLSKCYIECV